MRPALYWPPNLEATEEVWRDERWDFRYLPDPNPFPVMRPFRWL